MHLPTYFSQWQQFPTLPQIPGTLGCKSQANQTYWSHLYTCIRAAPWLLIEGYFNNPWGTTVTNLRPWGWAVGNVTLQAVPPLDRLSSVFSGSKEDTNCGVQGLVLTTSWRCWENLGRFCLHVDVFLHHIWYCDMIRVSDHKSMMMIINDKYYLIWFDSLDVFHSISKTTPGWLTLYLNNTYKSTSLWHSKVA